MKIEYNPIFRQWQAESDDGFTVAWGDTKEEAIQTLQEEMPQQENRKHCIYGRSLGERLEMCNVCSAVCDERIQVPGICTGCNNVKGCVTCVDGDQWAHIEEGATDDDNDLKEAIEAHRKELSLWGMPIGYIEASCKGFEKGAKWQRGLKKD